ncbi:hypothetical protein C8Q75DRAFT_736064 [Abortiporus biennis]|nr:hypothetical protein C8Q75DRAFT_736064 [Abortiporus biennis]
MNLSQLQGLPPSQVKRINKDADEKEADFLALRLLNKRARVRLSKEPINLDALPGRGNLFATGNHVGYFAAVTTSSGTYGLIVSPLSELRAAFGSSPSDEDISFTPKRTLPLPGPSNNVAFAFHDSRIVVALTSGQILVYDLQSTLSGAATSPIPTFPSPFGSAIRELHPNPEGIPELVAVLYDNDGVSWSPKGKQLALGLQSGDIVTFNPSDVSKLKSLIPRPTSLPSHALISTTWLSNPDFHSIYVTPGQLTPNTEQSHLILSLDAKANTCTELKLGAPYLPFPGIRLPGAFHVVLRGWEPSKFLLFIGDSTSSDIGLVGCTLDSSNHESWVNFSLEETSTPTVPLDKDSNDTVLLGLTLDLTETESYNHKTASGEDSVLPPPPIMYAYASDGTLTGWNILNTEGNPYPGMVVAGAAIPVSQSFSTSPMQTSSDAAAINSAPATPFGQTTATTITPSVFGQPTSTSAFSQPSGSSQSSGFGQPAAPSTFGQSSFGQPSGFGKPAFASSGGSGFGQTAFTTPSSFSSAAVPSSGGFGVFANAAPAKFGQSGFGGGSSTLAHAPSNQPLASPMAVSNANSEEPMAADNETDGGLGGLSLGGPSDSKPKAGFGATGMFGSLPTVDQNKPAGASTFGGAVKPATGFGAFANAGGPSPFSAAPSSGDTKPASAFGTTGFAAATTASTGFGMSQPSVSAFGQTGFGKTSFGQTAFGQTGFGSKPAIQSSTPSATSSTSFGSGGFGAFAQGGAASFVTAAKTTSSDSKPVWAASGNGDETKKDEQPKSAFALAPATSSAFASTTPKSFTTESASAASTTPSKPAAATQVSTTPSTPPPAEKKPSVFATPETPSSAKETDALKVPQSTTTPGSVFKSTAPPVTTGAFSNLKTSPGFGKLDSGFGAFGGGVSPSSPFYNPKTTTTNVFGGAIFGSTTPSTPPSAAPAKSVFGTSSFGGGTSAFNKSPATPQSAFGSPSPIGATSGGSVFGKSTWGSSPTPSTTPTTTPSASKSAAPATTSAFGAFSGGSAFSAFSSAASSEKKSFSDLLRTSGDENDKQVAAKKPVSVFSPQSSVGQGSSRSPGATPSETEEVEGEEEEDEESGFLSDDFSDGSSQEEELPEIPEGEEEEESLEEVEVPASLKAPADIPLPPSRSPTATPKLETPSILFSTPSPPATPEKEKEKASVLTREPSTTPPGSPAPSLSPPPPSTPVAAPIPVPSTSGFGLGLGRPSTRPTRSSPLAGAPISGEEDEDSSAGGKGKSPVKLEALKVPTGNIPSPSPSPTEGKSSSRPKTPPVLSLSPTPPSKPSVFSSGLGSLGQKPATAGSENETPSPLAPTSTLPASPFGTKPSESTPFGGLFSKLPAPPSAISPLPSKVTLPGSPQLSLAVAAPQVLLGQPQQGGLFTQKTSAPVTPASGGPFSNGPIGPGVPPPSGSLFGPKPTAGPSSLSPKPSFGFPTNQTPAPNAAAQPVPQVSKAKEAEIDLQSECAMVYMTLTKELESLKVFVQHSSQKRSQSYVATSGLRTAADLSDPTKWKIGDIPEYQRIMLGLENDISKLKDLRLAHMKAIRELESNMLRANTKKEEIARFSKASSDAEFARILKARTLSPEHLETQSQLRRQIRAVRDRIEKLEEHLTACKKRLNQMKTGKPVMRAPSIDTVQRTYRNIDLAISQQAEDVLKLSTRLSKLKLKSKSDNAGRERRLPEDSIWASTSVGNRAPTVVTPNVAATTAAALNAERAASRLKKALLKARKEPLLNKQAVEAPVAPSEYKTPQKLTNISNNLDSPLRAPDFGSPQLPDWKLPPFEPSENQETPPHGSRHRQKTTVLHGRSVPVKKPVTALPAPASPSPVPAGFSWGPLPGVAPMKTLPFDLRKSPGSTAPQPNSGAPSSSASPPIPSLSSSWVTEGFGAKK